MATQPCAKAVTKKNESTPDKKKKKKKKNTTTTTIPQETNIARTVNSPQPGPSTEYLPPQAPPSSPFQSLASEPAPILPESAPYKGKGKGKGKSSKKTTGKKNLFFNPLQHSKNCKLTNFLCYIVSISR